MLAQAQAGGGIPPAKLLLRDYLDQWLRDYATGACAPSTLRGYQFIVRRHVIPALGTTPISRLTAQAILGYLGTLRTRRLSATTALTRSRSPERGPGPCQRNPRSSAWRMPVSTAVRYTS